MNNQTTKTINKIKSLRLTYDSCYLVLYEEDEETGMSKDIFHDIPLLEDDVVVLLRKYGADIVDVYTDWNMDAPTLIPLYLRRAERIAKSADYKVNTVEVVYRSNPVDENESKEIYGQFIRNMK